MAEEAVSGIFNEAPIAEGAAHYEITGEELSHTNHMYLSQALMGRIPGLYIPTSNYTPGSEGVTIRVRGNATTSNQGPMVVLDGMKGASLNLVNVKDVEKVTVLKDAAAVALYGFEGANGVILITTKRGTDGGDKITVDVNQTMQHAIVKPTMLNSAQHAMLMNQAEYNDGNGEYFAFSQAEIDAYKDGGNSLYPSTNWYEMYMADYVHTTNASLSATGGGEFVKYYTNIDYYNVGSEFNTDNDYDTGYGTDYVQIRTNLDAKINDHIKAYVNIAANVKRDVNPRSGSVYTSIFQNKPMQHGPLTDSNQVVITNLNTNPTYGLLNRSGYNKGTESTIVANMGVNFDLNFITSGLTASVEGMYRNYLYSITNANTDYERWTADVVNDTLVYARYNNIKNEPITLTKSTSSNYAAQFDANLAYNRAFGKHRVGANVIFSYQTYMSQGANFGTMNIGCSAHASYAYDNALFLDVIVGGQGTEQFMPGNRYGVFPSGSVAWVPTNHDFMKNDVLTHMKVRGSFGEVGYNGFSGDAGQYIYKDVIVRENGYAGLGNGIITNQYANKDLTWEKAQILNVGADFEFFHDLTLSVDYFNQNRYDVLVQSDLDPQFIGVTDAQRPWKNDGGVRNHGVDIALNYNTKFNKDWSFSAVGFASFSSNKVTATGTMAYDETYAYPERKVGYSIGQMWGYEIDYSNGNGYFNSAEELANSGLNYIGAQPRVGDFIYVDHNDDGNIDERDIVPMKNSKGKLAQSLPDWFFGLELAAQWKNLDFSILLEGMTGVTGWANGLGFVERQSNGTFFSHHLEAWTQDRYDAGLPISGPALSMDGGTSSWNNNHYISTKNYFKLANIQVGYNIPINEKYSFRVYASGQNLLTADDFKSEDMHVENSNLSSFPAQRYYTLGLNFNF